MASDPTGERFRLERPGVTAEFAQVGAALRGLTVGGVDLVPRYPDDIPTPGASGIVLVPWPNRVRDGVWTRDGVTRELAMTERSLGNASHGLLRYAPYTLESADAGRHTLRADVFPQTGYPFHLETRVTHELAADGLVVRHDLRNVGADPAPVALGTHPYLMIAGVDTAELRVQTSAATRAVLDEQKIPVGTAPVDEATDLREGRLVGELDLDCPYTDLTPGDDGRVRHTLTAPDGRAVTLWQDANFPWVQVFTSVRYPGHPLAIAIEPMTAPADAFNSGTDLRVLAPGEQWTLEWGISFG